MTVVFILKRHMELNLKVNLSEWARQQKLKQSVFAFTQAHFLHSERAVCGCVFSWSCSATSPEKSSPKKREREKIRQKVMIDFALIAVTSAKLFNSLFQRKGDREFGFFFPMSGSLLANQWQLWAGLCLEEQVGLLTYLKGNATRLYLPNIESKDTTAGLIFAQSHNSRTHTHTHTEEEDCTFFTAIIITQQSSPSATCSTFSRQQRSPSPPRLQQNPLAPEHRRYSGGCCMERGGRKGRKRRKRWVGGTYPSSPHNLRDSLPHEKKKKKNLDVLRIKTFAETMRTGPKARN